MTSIPQGAKKPADRKKAKTVDARRAEAEGYVDIEQNGVTLRVPVRGKIPYKAALAFKEGNEDLGNRLLFGDEQWDAWLDTDPTLDDAEELGQKVGDVLGN